MPSPELCRGIPGIAATRRRRVRNIGITLGRPVARFRPATAWSPDSVRLLPSAHLRKPGCRQHTRLLLVQDG
jgi:hypothetical protein